VNLRPTADAVANRNSARRGRSRKRRPARSSSERSSGGEQAADAPAAGEPSPGRAVSAQRRARTPRQAGAAGARSADERPPAPWHPLPLSELLIFIGAIVTVIGLRRTSSGFSAGAPALAAGLAAVLIGTIEVTLREHRSGYRSHALLLAALPVIVFHSLVVLIVAAFTPVPRLLNVGLLVLDVGLFALLFKLLRARFVDARRERRFAAGR
jgi:hypothetical protein